MSMNMGYLYIFLCCVMNSVSFVFIAHLNQTHNEMLSIAMIFGYATLLFHACNFRNLRLLYRKIFQNGRLLCTMNFITLLNWGSSFFALNYLDPATILCVNLGILAITMFFISVPFKNFRENKHLITCIALILLSMGLIINQHIETTAGISAKTMLLGLFWCIIGGISGAFIGTQSVRMGKVGFSITQILATRFYILTIFGVIMVLFFTPHAKLIIIDWKYYFLASLIVVLFPLLMYQAAIKAIGPLIVSLLEPFTPVMTYFLQVSVSNDSFNSLTFLLLIMSCSGVVWLVNLEQKMAKNGKK